MRNWCLASALSVLLASPLCAQQKAAGFPDDTAGPGEAAAAKSSLGTGNAVATDQPSFPKEVFAIPAIPRAKPFPNPQKGSAKATEAPGQLVPRYEISGMYFYINAAPGSPFSNFGNQGGGASFTYNASRWLGLTGELGGYNFDRRGGREPAKTNAPAAKKPTPKAKAAREPLLQFRQSGRRRLVHVQRLAMARSDRRTRRIQIQPQPLSSHGKQRFGERKHGQLPFWPAPQLAQIRLLRAVRPLPAGRRTQRH